MNRTLARFAFYGVAAVLLMWTASLTISFVGNALPGSHWLIPIFSLVVFDGGMLAWLIVFLYHAEGSGQRVIAISSCLLDFAGVALMVIAEIFLGGQSLAAAPERLGEYALWAIGIWTTANVGAVIGFHLFDNDNRQRMALQTQKDEVFAAALKRLDAKRIEMGGELAEQLADGMIAALVADLATDRDRNGIPDVYQRKTPDKLSAVSTVAPDRQSDATPLPDIVSAGSHPSTNGAAAPRRFQQGG